MLRHIWGFIAAVVQRWGVLTTGRLVVALIGLWEHLTGRPIAGWPLSLAVALSLASACFSAWRKERLTVESLTAHRPDFYYEGAGSQVTLDSLRDAKNQPIVQINFLLRFINQGAGTAYNLSSKIYACWINDNQRKAKLADSTEPSVGRTRPGEAKSLGFSAWRYAVRDSSISGGSSLNPSDILIILVEIRFQQARELDSPITENEPIWKMWDPRIPGNLCDASKENVRVAKEAIDALKTESAVPG